MSPTAIDREIAEIAGAFLKNRDLNSETRLKPEERRHDLSISRRKRLVNLRPPRHLRPANF